MTLSQNLITDVAGVGVGSAHDATIRSGVTVVLPPAGCIAAVDIRGGGPGTLDTAALAPQGTIEEIHAIAFCRAALHSGWLLPLGFATG